jgi:hypothetical protein
VDFSIPLLCVALRLTFAAGARWRSPGNVRDGFGLEGEAVFRDAEEAP